ncbi:signal transduction histidine kinase [Ornithinimicrobium sp. CNJ-824]|uniref:DUF3046 domain-containing protein n=1 Tax=Ornithinimicrobium sp. CNJ-824 TaxID=1904966 RepID=UPI00096799C0|nr:DUF3046 domain-containing protein [Ornithinimicrobium sp. CNJ-824]OLT23292.1 signal transduction histidine kinase [Ornithinimicrobium sp. CNJ-824]
MRLSEFWALMEQEFGQGYAALVAQDQALGSLGSRTVEQALADGEPVRQVWRAVVNDLDVPPEHHHLPDRRRSRS